ncbi:polyphosphate polymerase domain-containing protein [Clostridium malenominatum]|uniref:Polyphosphate polymerase domain-containing protein n=1 Tax=Clostridium malenominatum TaxID=1539 RepID=A0ABN1ITB7_9CLOT
MGINIDRVQKDIQVYRHEEKYYIRKVRAFELSGLLKAYMKKDEHGDGDGSYWIRSLYFDDYRNSDYVNKQDGIADRKKLRLRIYNLESNSVKLELKNRYGIYMMKESATISNCDAKLMISGESSNLLNYNSVVATKVYYLMHKALYRPKVIIDYEREAYTYPFENIRVTIDKNIRASNSDFNIFNDKINMLPVIEDDVYVLEIKYDNMFPEFLQKVISTYTVSRSSVSKYCLGRQTINR